MNKSRSFEFVCRTCLKIINENEPYTTADTNTKYGKTIDILETCISELNLDLTNDVVLCNDCTTTLNICYNFKLKCLRTEDIIFNYIQKNNLKLFNKISLIDLLNTMNNVNLRNSNQPHTEGIFIRGEDIGQNSGQNVQIREPEICEKGNTNTGVLMFENVISDSCLRDTNFAKDKIENNIKTNPDWNVQQESIVNSNQKENLDSIFSISPINLCDESFEDFLFRRPLM